METSRIDRNRPDHTETRSDSSRREAGKKEAGAKAGLKACTSGGLNHTDCPALVTRQGLGAGILRIPEPGIEATIEASTASVARQRPQLGIFVKMNPGFPSVRMK
jgi:hypothetical protein